MLVLFSLLGKLSEGQYSHTEMPVPITCLLQGPLLLTVPGCLRPQTSPVFIQPEALLKHHPTPLYRWFSHFSSAIWMFLFYANCYAFLNKRFLHPPFIDFCQWKLVLFALNFFNLGRLVTINWK